MEASEHIYQSIHLYVIRPFIQGLQPITSHDSGILSLVALDAINFPRFSTFENPENYVHVLCTLHSEGARLYLLASTPATAGSILSQ